MDDDQSSGVDKDKGPGKDEQLVEQGERNRQKLDEVPEPGTDPLHEGP